MRDRLRALERHDFAQHVDCILKSFKPGGVGLKIDKSMPELEHHKFTQQEGTEVGVTVKVRPHDVLQGRRMAQVLAELHIDRLMAQHVGDDSAECWSSMVGGTFAQAILDRLGCQDGAGKAAVCAGLRI